MKKNEKKKEDQFKEFKYSGKTFEYSGRIYEASEGNGKVKTRSYVSLTLNDSFTINGVYYVETEDAGFLTFPQYKKGDEYKSYIFTDKDIKDELDGLCGVLHKLVY